jgi:hypothetical protein
VSILINSRKIVTDGEYLEDDLLSYLLNVAAELGLADDDAIKNAEILKSKGVTMSTLQIVEQKLISDWGLHFSLIITAQNNIVSVKARIQIQLLISKPNQYNAIFETTIKHGYRKIRNRRSAKFKNRNRKPTSLLPF